MNKNFPNLALLSLADLPSGVAPESFTLLRLGRNDYTKGGARGSFDFAREDAERIIADFQERGKDLVVDYDHQSMAEGVQAPAAGWIRALRITGEGIEANVEWTAKAREVMLAHAEEDMKEKKLTVEQYLKARRGCVKDAEVEYVVEADLQESDDPWDKPEGGVPRISFFSGLEALGKKERFPNIGRRPKSLILNGGERGI